MQRNLRKQLQKLKLNAYFSQHLQNNLKVIETQCKTTVNYIIGCCHLLLKITEKIIINKPFSDLQLLGSAQSILEIVKGLILKVRNEDVFEIQLIKIKLFLLTVRTYRINRHLEETSKKIKLFLQTLEANIYFNLIQEDFYSHIELVYLQATKACLREEQPHQALKYAKSCFVTVKRQLGVLMDYQQSFKDEKFKKILQRKSKTLEILFYLEHGARLTNDNLSSEQIIYSMIPVYEKLFSKTKVAFDIEELVARAMKSIQSKVTLKEQQSDTLSNAPLIRLSRSSQSVQEKRISIEENTTKQIINSIKFMQQIDGGKRESCKNQVLSAYVLQNVEEKTNQKLALRKNIAKESRFSKEKLDKHNRESILEDMEENSLKSKKLRSQSIMESFTKQNIQGHRQNRFSLVVKAQANSKEKLIQLNPLKINQQKRAINIARPSTNDMLKNGILAVCIL